MAKGKGKNGAKWAPAPAPPHGAGRRAQGLGSGMASTTAGPEPLPLAPGVKYRRILLKLSGEALMGSGNSASTRRRSPRSPTS